MIGGFLRKYAAFGGRATRSEFWGFALASVIVFAVIGFLAGFGAMLSPGELPIMAMPLVAYGVGMVVPGLAAMTRRFHDAGFSGRLGLMLLVPIVGWIVLAVFMALPSERGDNEYGPDPRVKARQPYRPQSGAKTWAGHPGYAGWDGSRFGNGDATFL